MPGGATSPWKAQPPTGLRLTWPRRVEVRASEFQGVQIILANVGDVIWVADPQDGQYVHAWLLAQPGRRTTRLDTRL